MNNRFFTTLLTGTLIMATALPLAVQAGRGGGPRGGTLLQTQSQDRLRLRDGSCLNSSANQLGSGVKRGNTFGPGNGTGNAGNGPKDGTGYGSPSQR
jgi:hypothetical protein